MEVEFLNFWDTLYKLLPNKDQAMYTRLIVEIQNRSSRVVARSIYVDFEMAIHNSFRSEFPEIEIQGCFFHLLKNLKKQVASSSLMVYVKTFILTMYYSYYLFIFLMYQTVYLWGMQEGNKVGIILRVLFLKNLYFLITFLLEFKKVKLSLDQIFFCSNL